MVLDVFSDESDVMPLYFFEQGYRINADAFTDIFVLKTETQFQRVRPRNLKPGVRWKYLIIWVHD